MGIAQTLYYGSQVIQLGANPPHGVGQVAEVGVGVHLQKRVVSGLQQLQHRYFGAHDAPVGQDVPPNDGEPAGQRLSTAPVEYPGLQVIHRRDQVGQDGKHVLHQTGQDAVEQVARAVTHHVAADLLAAFAVGEQLGQGAELAGLNGNDVVPANEEVHLHRPGHAGLPRRPGEMEHQKQVVGVVIQLGQLQRSQAVFQRQLVEVVVLAQVLRLGQAGISQVHPSKGSVLQLSDV